MQIEEEKKQASNSALSEVDFDRAMIVKDHIREENQEFSFSQAQL